jgi:regulator of protease activity HflC (stomatin/prohibitin superfamily)
VVEVPVDDREQTFLFSGRTSDFQDVSVQGVVTFRVVDPEILAERVDFGLDLELGLHLGEPLEQLTSIVTQLAQELVLDYLSHTKLRPALADGVSQIRDLLDDRLRSAPELGELGIEVVSVRIVAVRPAPETEKALQTPVREAIQQESDEAMFDRRAAAVENERAIAENELANEIELARRRESLIDQQGRNDRRQAEEAAEAKRITVESDAELSSVRAAAQAESIAAVETARNDAERHRIEIYRTVPTGVLYGLAARELAGNLPAIEHLTLAPDALLPMLQSLIGARTRSLEQ